MENALDSSMDNWNGQNTATEAEVSFAVNNNEEGEEDLHTTLSVTMALRKNLELAFEEEAIHAPTAASAQQSIGQYERASVDLASAGYSRPPLAQQSNGNTHTRVSTGDRKKGLPVFLRIRPSHTDSTVEVVSNTQVRTYPPASSQALKSSRGQESSEVVKQYDFSKVLTQDASQLDVYQSTAAPMVHGLVDRQRGIGRSGLLFSYGITNAGKTHTVLGNISKKKEAWGLVPRAVSDVLDRLPPIAQLTMSYFEIYNENVYDLLPQSLQNENVAKFADPLKVREWHGRAVVSGLAKHRLHSLQQGLDLIVMAKQRRHTATNNINRDSSRSHCVCQLTVETLSSVASIHEGVAMADDDVSVASESNASYQQANLWIVDLAGSERSKRTGVGRVRQAEAGSINKSLMTLMRCLTALRETQEHSITIVPYRDSKLTLLFMNHLTSDAAANTAMIVNIHPGSSEYDETQHVLQYAAASRTITVANLETAVLSKARTNVPTTSEYGYDGRKKENSVARRVMAVVKKLSPKRVMADRKRKPVDKKSAPIKSTGENGVDGHPGPAAKKVRSQSSASAVADGLTSHKEAQSLKIQLSIARAEIEVLTAQNQEWERKVDSVETEVRGEVAEEMEEHMQSMREQYEETIDVLRSKMRSQTTTSAQSAKKIHLSKATEKIDELMEKVEECEEEMQRMHSEHTKELQTIREKCKADLTIKETELQEAYARIATLEQQANDSKDLIQKSATLSEIVKELRGKLAESHAQVEKLEKSKLELIQGYENLLRDEDEDAEGDSQGEDDSDEGEDENEGPHGDDGHCSKATCTRRLTRQTMRESPAPRQMTQSGNTQDSTSSEEPRNPLSSLSGNTRCTASTSSSSDESFGPSKWLQPTKKAAKCPKSGTYQRPRGRAPTGVQGWDEHKGAWRLSFVPH
jgi:hypothetical protein